MATERILTYKITVTGTEAQVKELGRHDIAIKKLAGDTRLLEKRALELANQNKQGGIEFKGLTKKIGENRAKIIDLRNAKNSLAKTISNESKLNRTNANTIGQVNAQLAIEKKRINDVVVGSKKFNIIARRIKDLERKQRDFNAQLGRGRTFVGEYSRGAIDAFKRVALAVGGALIVFRGLQRITTGSIGIFRDFEAQMARVESITGASAEEFEQLTKNAKELGRTTVFTASEIGKLQESFAKLGFSTQEILDATEATSQLAAATGEDLAQAALVTGKVIRAFGLDTAETQKVVDILAKTLTATATINLAEFEVSMAKIAPIATKMGFSLEGVSALLGVLRDAGLDASIAGTSLRSIFLKLADANGVLAKALGRPVKSLDDFIPALKELQEKGIDVASALEITDKRSVTAFLTFLDGADKLKVLNKEMETAGGTAERMAEVQIDTLAGSTKLLTSAWEGFILTLLEGEGGIGQVIRKIVDLITGIISLVSGAKKMSEEWITAIKIIRTLIVSFISYKVATIAATFATKSFTLASIRANVITKALAITSKIYRGALLLTAAATNLVRGNTVRATAAMRVFNTVTKLNPIGLILGAITAAITAFQLFGSAVKEATEEQKRFNEEQKEVQRLIEASQDITLRIGLLNELSKTQTENLKQEIEELIKADEERILSAKLLQKRKQLILQEALKEGEELLKQSLESELTLQSETANQVINIKRFEAEKVIETEKDITENQLTENRTRLEEQQKLVDERLELLAKEGDDKGFLTQKEIDRLKRLREKEAEERRKRVEENNKIILDLEKQLLDDKLKLIEEDFEKTKELADRKVQAEADLARAKLEIRLLEAETLEEEREIELELEDVRFQEELDRLRLRQDATKEEIKVNQQEIELLTKTHEDNKTKIEQNATQKRLKIAQDVGQIIGSLVNAVANIFEAAKQRELSAAGDNADKRAEIEKKFANKQKAISLIQAGVNTALAVTAGLESPAIPPFPSAIAAGIAGAVQIGIIAATKFAKGGILKGKSHEEGGIAFTVDGQSGFEAEGGEILVNKNIHSRPDFVDAISTMNHITGGKRFQAGAIIPTPNITRIQQQPIFQDVFTREEAVELIQEGIAVITVQQVESEVTETQKTVETIESGVEF